MEILCNDVLEIASKLLKERMNLTIIVAMKESDDSLLIGADSMNTEDGGLKAIGAVKLFRHDKENIVWGTSGNREISRHEFSPWLQSLSIEGGWEWLKLTIADKIAELNGRQRERETKAGVPHNSESVIGCLLVGWLNGESQIYEFTNDGRIDSYIQDQFRAIGGGMPVAHGAYGAMKRTLGIENLNKFKIILETTITSTIACGGKFFIKRVNKDGVIDV